MQGTSRKDEVRRLVEAMPDDFEWEDLLYEVYVRQAVDRGLADADAGRVRSVSEVRKIFGLG